MDLHGMPGRLLAISLGAGGATCGLVAILHFCEGVKLTTAVAIAVTVVLAACISGGIAELAARYPARVRERSKAQVVEAAIEGRITPHTAALLLRDDVLAALLEECAERNLPDDMP